MSVNGALAVFCLSCLLTSHVQLWRLGSSSIPTSWMQLGILTLTSEIVNPSPKTARYPHGAHHDCCANRLQRELIPRNLRMSRLGKVGMIV